MTFKRAILISMVLIVSVPAWAAGKSSHHKANRSPASMSEPKLGSAQSGDLGRIYQSLIRDSRKQLTPSLDKQSVYLPTANALETTSRSPASEGSKLPVRAEGRYPSSLARHAAIPWAADVNGGGAVFSVK